MKKKNVSGTTQVSSILDILPPDAKQRLREIVRLGEVSRESASQVGSCTAPGYFAWNERLTRLRVWLMAHGWKMVRTQKGLEVCVDPTGKVAIATRRGDSGTGTEQGPRLLDVGEATQEATRRNDQLERQTVMEVVMEMKPALPPAPAPQEEKWRTYILLVYRDPVLKEVRCELSLPVNLVEENGKTLVFEWEQRNILDPVPLDDDRLEEPQVDDESEVDISVEPRRRDN